MKIILTNSIRCISKPLLANIFSDKNNPLYYVTVRHTVEVKITCRFSHRRTIVLLSNRRRSSPVVCFAFRLRTASTVYKQNAVQFFKTALQKRPYRRLNTARKRRTRNALLRLIFTSKCRTDLQNCDLVDFSSTLSHSLSKTSIINPLQKKTVQVDRTV